MPDLAHEFFERDLSDAEWRELGRQLEAEDAVKDRFLQGAEAYWQGLGLPEPGAGGSGGPGWLGGWKGLGLGLLLGGLAGGAAVWTLRPRGPEALPQPLPSPAALPTPVPAVAQPAPPAETPSLSPPPRAVQPARQASPGFPNLAAVVELSRQGLVTARVLDSAGQEQRLLFAGVLEPGRWSFGWDGKDEAGRLVPGGTYHIEVQEGRRVLRQAVQLSAHPAAGAP